MLHFHHLCSLKEASNSFSVPHVSFRSVFISFSVQTHWGKHFNCRSRDSQWLSKKSVNTPQLEMELNFCNRTRQNVWPWRKVLHCFGGRIKWIKDSDQDQVDRSDPEQEDCRSSVLLNRSNCCFSNLKIRDFLGTIPADLPTHPFGSWLVYGHSQIAVTTLDSWVTTLSVAISMHTPIVWRMFSPHCNQW